jgi:hypothetical protein
MSGNIAYDNLGAWRRFPAGRQLHLVDIENLACDSQPSLSRVREVRDLYAERVDLGAMDQVEVAASGSRTLAARLGAQGVRVTVVSWRRSLSPELKMAAHDVIYLDAAAEAA